MWKIRGEDNFSDSFTKHASPERIAQTMIETSQAFAGRRRSIMPAVAQFCEFLANMTIHEYVCELLLLPVRHVM